MSITVAHNCNIQYGISRGDQDEWALRSHQRAIQAIDAGAFVDEIIPIQVPQADGTTITFAEDEHPRRGSSMESLAGLKVLHPEIDGFSVTAGNSSGINDAAAVVALASPDTKQDVLASVLSWTQVGLDPTRTGSGPIKAIPKALELAGRKLEDVALFEINEAFAARLRVGHQPRPPDRGDRCPDGHLGNLRIAQARRRYRRAVHVRRWWHGCCDGHRGGLRWPH
jgi:acetyl-CoA acetyltransferase